MESEIRYPIPMTLSPFPLSTGPIPNFYILHKQLLDSRLRLYKQLQKRQRAEGRWQKVKSINKNFSYEFKACPPDTLR